MKRLNEFKEPRIMTLSEVLALDISDQLKSSIAAAVSPELKRLSSAGLSIESKAEEMAMAPIYEVEKIASFNPIDLIERERKVLHLYEFHNLFNEVVPTAKRTVAEYDELIDSHVREIADILKKNHFEGELLPDYGAIARNLFSDSRSLIPSLAKMRDLDVQTLAQSIKMGLAVERSAAYELYQKANGGIIELDEDLIDAFNLGPLVEEAIKDYLRNHLKNKSKVIELGFVSYIHPRERTKESTDQNVPKIMQGITPNAAIFYQGSVGHRFFDFKNGASLPELPPEFRFKKTGEEVPCQPIKLSVPVTFLSHGVRLFLRTVCTVHTKADRLIGIW